MRHPLCFVLFALVAARASLGSAPASSCGKAILQPQDLQQDDYITDAVGASPISAPGGGYFVAMASPEEIQTLPRFDDVPPPCPNEVRCRSPYASSAWRVQFDLIPTSSPISAEGLGYWEDEGALAARLGLGFEGDDGIGSRVLFWGFSDKPEATAGGLEIEASTFYWDFYKRFFVQDAEVVVGGGLAGAYFQYDLTRFGEEAHTNAGGISVFGEAFYPLWRFQQTDLGSVVRGRLALLSGKWREQSVPWRYPFVRDTNNDSMSILEIAWGLELRHRFGRMQDKYWYIDIVPEFQSWASAALVDTFDPSFQGTNISFGLAW